MLRKRSRPLQQDQSGSKLMADLAFDSSSISSDNVVVHKSKCSPFFSVPGLFVGLTTKNIIDSDSAKSPTSPLDCKLFTNLSNSFVKSPRSPGFEGHPKSWVSNRVGLISLIDSLNDESKNILLGSQMRISKTHLNPLKGDHVLQTSTKSLPKDYVISLQTQLDSPKFEIGSCGNESPRTCSLYLNSSKSNSEVFSSDMKNTQLSSSALDSNLSGSMPFTVADGNCFMGSLSASGIELSEDYTCIISHGPNPKTTHIFGDCILDNDTIRSLGYKNYKTWDIHLPSDDFLSHCFSCKKKLEQGEDIYMYRGDRAFCSSDCRDKDILCEEKMEKSTIDEDFFVSGMAL